MPQGCGGQQDREAQHKTVEAILAEAALANTQLAVTKAVLKAEFCREGATVEEAAAKVEEAVEQMATQLVFGRVPLGAKDKQRRARPEVKVLYFRSLFEAELQRVQAAAETEQDAGSSPLKLAVLDHRRRYLEMKQS